MLNWHKLSLEDKNSQFTKHTCHELNLFIYKKDREYFDAVVKPFLACKMEKSFIDHYLLGNVANIMPYMHLMKL